MTSPIKQHYVPRFYLKNFSDSNGYIFCYDKLENKCFSANIRDIAEEKFFYEVEGLEQGSVEKYLGSLETSFKIAYDSLVKSIESPSEDSQRNLFLFIAAQILRTPEFRSYLQNGFNQGLNKFAQKIGINFPPEIKIRADEGSIKLMHIQSIMEETINFANILYNQKWFTEENATDMPLWTSDSPVAIDNRHSHELGLLSRGREIHFPLTRNLCLSSYDPVTHRPPTINKLEFMNISYHNILQIRRSNRFVFSFDNDFTLAQRFLNEYPYFKNPYRDRLKVY